MLFVTGSIFINWGNTLQAYTFLFFVTEVNKKAHTQSPIIRRIAILVSMRINFSYRIRFK